MKLATSDMEINRHGKLVFPTLDTFERVIRYAIANRNEHLAKYLLDEFKIRDDGAFSIEHAPTIARLRAIAGTKNSTTWIKD